MLLNYLYVIVEKSIKENLIEVLIKLNASHEIFYGHFPSNPILPGVCELQIVKEILEVLLDRKLKLQKTNEVKFLKIIEPSVDRFLSCSIQYENLMKKIHVNAKISNAAGTICFKMKGTLEEAFNCLLYTSAV